MLLLLLVVLYLLAGIPLHAHPILLQQLRELLPHFLVLFLFPLSQ